MKFNYNDCFETLAMYANETLPLFADGWSRFPEGRAAKEITTTLETRVKFWEEHDSEVAGRIKNTITAINENLPK